jgi:hypothetical protein
MRWSRIIISGLLLVAAPLAAVWAQQLRSINQMPALVDHESTMVHIANLGTVDLSMLYLDGTWKPVQIPSGSFVSLPSQGGSVSISYNDGVEAKSASLDSNSAYALHWNTETSRWTISPYDEVAKRPNGLRSR